MAEERIDVDHKVEYVAHRRIWFRGREWEWTLLVLLCSIMKAIRLVTPSEPLWCSSRKFYRGVTALGKESSSVVILCLILSRPRCISVYKLQVCDRSKWRDVCRRKCYGGSDQGSAHVWAYLRCDWRSVWEGLELVILFCRLWLVCSIPRTFLLLLFHLVS